MIASFFISPHQSATWGFTATLWQLVLLGRKKKQKKMEWEKKKRRGYRRKSLTILNLSLWEGFTRQARRVRLICFSFLFFFSFPEWNIGEEQEESCWAVKSTPACLSRVPIGVQLPWPCVSPPASYICSVNPETRFCTQLPASVLHMTPVMRGKKA